MSEHITNVKPTPAPANAAPAAQPEPHGRLTGNQKILFYGLLGVLVGVIALGTWSAVRHLQAWNHYREAEKALKRHDLEAAQAHVEACLAVWPKSADAHFLAARTFRQLGDFDKADEQLKQCQQLGYDAAAVKLERTMMDVQRPPVDPSKEKELLQAVEDDHPESALILEALVDGYLQSNSLLAPALRCLNQWLEREPDRVKALMLRGDLLLYFRDQDSALKDYQRALELEPDNVEVRRHLAEALLAIPRPREAMEQFDLLPAAQRENPDVMLGMARCKAELGERAEATRLLDALLKREPDNAAALRERGQLALKVGQLSKAETYLRRAVLLSPLDRMANFLLFQTLEKQGQQRGPVWAPCAPWLFLYQGWNQFEARLYQLREERIGADEKRLQEIMIELQSKGSRDPAVYTEGGWLQLRLGQPEEAQRWFATAVHLDSGNRSARNGMREAERLLGPR
jgi:tetratricopeptide (TPR) repeat protein